MGGEAPAGRAMIRSLTRRQMLDDFRHLFEIIRDNYPFLWSKARFEGYDWIAHEKEFEQWVLRANTDERFARTICRIVKLLNNGHTSLAGESGVRSDLQSPAKRWTDEASKTTPERAGYWATLAGRSYDSGKFTGQEPFAAVYNAGEYIVVGVSEDPRVSGKVEPGFRVVAVNGEPVHEFVAGQRGESWLKYDPLRRRVYLSRLMLPELSGHLRAAFETSEGKRILAELPGLVELWPDPYRWPPEYAGQTREPAVHLDIIQGKIGYVQVRQMGSKPDDAGTMRAFFEQTRNLPAIVIDIRGNCGGADLFWMQNLYGLLAARPASLNLRFAWRSGRQTLEFLESKIDSLAAVGLSRDLLPVVDPRSCREGPPELHMDAFGGLVDAVLPLPVMNSIGYQGKVLVLVDDGVFSAAETFAAFCKSSGWATLVGECTGGDGIGFDPSTVALPNSGIYVRYSTTLGLNSDWSINEEMHTHPDVLVERAPEDLLRYLRLQAAGPVPGPDPAWDTALRECLRIAVAS